MTHTAATSRLTAAPAPGGEPLRVLFVAEGNADVARAVRALTEAGWCCPSERLDSEVAYRTALDADSFDLVISDQALPSFDAQRALALLRDRDERRQRASTEAALPDSEARYRALIENAPDVLMTIDAAGAVTSLNPAFSSLLGWPREAYLGRPIAPLLHPDDLPAATAALQQLRAGAAVRALPLRARSAAGDYRVIEISAVLQAGNDDGAAEVLAIGRDVTGRWARRGAHPRTAGRRQRSQRRPRSAGGPAAGVRAPRRGGAVRHLRRHRVPRG